jgi:hypothetical protein
MCWTVTAASAPPPTGPASAVVNVDDDERREGSGHPANPTDEVTGIDIYTGFVYDASTIEPAHLERTRSPARCRPILLASTPDGPRRPGFAWGSSYFFIKVGIESGLQPLTLVAWRLTIGILGLLVLLRPTRSRVSREWRVLARIAVMGIFYVAVPFMLITWAERSIGSALATILQALTPLFALVIAALVLEEEPVTINKLAPRPGFGGAAILARHRHP